MEQHLEMDLVNFNEKILMAAVAAAAVALPAHSDPIAESEFFTNHSMGCMLLQECTDHVQELKTVSDFNKDTYSLILITVLLLMSLVLSSIT